MESFWCWLGWSSVSKKKNSFLMECLCIAPLIPTVMVMKGYIFHPLFCMVLYYASYLRCFGQGLD